MGEVVDIPKHKLADKSDKKLAEPPKFNAILWNDASTPFETVIHVLLHHFNLDKQRAANTMLTAHTTGKALVEVFASKDLAETRVAEAMNCVAVGGTELTITVERAE